MNILIIEDDFCLGEKIWEMLQEKVITNRVTVLRSFESFIVEYADITHYDLILTDLNLWNHREPEGFEIIKRIREKHTNIPVIVISGYDDIEKLRYAFSIGANDYIIKPIRLKELEIRITNWFQTFYFSQITFLGKQYSYKSLSYHIGQNRFSYDDRDIPLSRRSKYILSLLFANPEKLLTEKYLKEKIWWDHEDSEERNIRVNILRLKKALVPYGIADWIQNIHGEGYILRESSTLF